MQPLARTKRASQPGGLGAQIAHVVAVIIAFFVVMYVVRQVARDRT